MDIIICNLSIIMLLNCFCILWIWRIAKPTIYYYYKNINSNYVVDTKSFCKKSSISHFSKVICMFYKINFHWYHKRFIARNSETSYLNGEIPYQISMNISIRNCFRFSVERTSTFWTIDIGDSFILKNMMFLR